MNTVSNTPAHCHDCFKFADCDQAQHMGADTQPVEGYVCDGEVYCANCNDGDDSNLYEGESDSPTHCGGCGVPIIHELTVEGVRYVCEELYRTDGCCRELWPAVWAEYDVRPIIPVDSIGIPVRFIELCVDWYSGIDCKLYAVASSKALTIGTRRPRGCDSTEKWYLTIWRELSCDIGYAVKMARKACEDYDNPVDNIDLDDLIRFEDWADAQIERLEESYGLADWDACDD